MLELQTKDPRRAQSSESTWHVRCWRSARETFTIKSAGLRSNAFGPVLVVCGFGFVVGV